MSNDSLLGESYINQSGEWSGSLNWFAWQQRHHCGRCLLWFLWCFFFILICADSDFGLAGIKNVHRVNAGGAEWEHSAVQLHGYGSFNDRGLIGSSRCMTVSSCMRTNLLPPLQIIGWLIFSTLSFDHSSYLKICAKHHFFCCGLFYEYKVFQEWFKFDYICLHKLFE